MSKKYARKKTESDERSFLSIGSNFLLVCLSCLQNWNFLLVGLEKGSKEDSAISRESMSSDYRNKQYQDGNKMCEKSSACDRIRDKTDSNIKVCRFVTQQDLANKTLW